MTSLLQDLHYAIRNFRKSPGFFLIAILTLSIGIGAATAIFSAVNPILFEPLPYPRPNQIMMVWDIFQGERSDVTFHTYREISTRNRSFDSLAVMDTWQPTMTSAGEPERFNGQIVSAAYFQTLGVAPALGRNFQAADDILHGPKVAILSNALWKRRFNSDSNIIGRSITLDGDIYTVIGVMKHGFDNVLSPDAEIWSPLQYSTANIGDHDSVEWGHHLRMIGRLRGNMSEAEARQDLAILSRTPVDDFPRVPWASLKDGFIIHSLQSEVTRGIRPALLAILGAVMLVLLITCVNVTNLLLARGEQRRGEFAVRAALGAPRVRLIRQQLTESLFLAACGGLLGLIVAQNGVSMLVAMSPPNLPRVGAIGLNGAVFAFAFGITTIIGLVIGLLPAMSSSRRGLIFGLQQSSQRSTGGRKTVRGALVVAEVALSFVLLVSAGLLLRSFERLASVPPGFDAQHLLTMEVQASGHQFDDTGNEPGAGAEARRRFYAQALAQVQRTPGVASAAFTSLLPLNNVPAFNQDGMYGAQFEKDQRAFDVFRYVVSPDYFETMRIPLLRGRQLEERDAADAPPAVVISESLTKHEFGVEDPIGQHVHIGPRNRQWYTVVGVVGDVKQVSLALNDSDAVYITPAQSWFADEMMTLVARSSGESAPLTTSIKNAIWSVDKDQPIVQIATMDSLLALSSAERRFTLILFEAFALIALLLAAIGIYGVLAGSVAERTRELGIRSALGASPAHILSMVIRQGVELTTFGLAIGFVGAAAATVAIGSLIFGISKVDPLTYIGVTPILLIVAASACWIPAKRASRVDPITALRNE